MATNIYGFFLLSMAGIELTDPIIQSFYVFPPFYITNSEIIEIFSHKNFTTKIDVVSSFTYNSKLYYVLGVKNNMLIVMITNLDYPHRVAYMCVKELELHCRINSIEKNTFLLCYDKYNNLEKIDALTKVSNKVNNVKEMMHDNIAKSLENVEQLEVIYVKADDLMQSAGVFRDNTRKLKNKMWWKNMKMKLLFASIIIVILVITISVGVILSKSK
jgi:hypothetical protein